MVKFKRIFQISSCALMILLIGGMAVIGNYFYNITLDPKSPENIVTKKNSGLDAQVLNVNKYNWLLDDSNYDDAYITSYDKLNLHGYKVENPSNSDVWVIVAHGYMGEALKMSSAGEEFYKMGYNVLLLDLRGHGKSEGDYIGMGWDERKDILEWINYIINENSDSRIILYGTSMGGAAVMNTAGEDIPENIKVIVEDCGYTSVEDEFAYQLDIEYSIPAFPIVQVSSVAAKIRAGYWLKDAAPINQIKKCKVPVLFIQGDQDKFVPFYMLDKLYNAADCEKEKLVIEGAGHDESSEVDPETYWNAVRNFVMKHI